MIATQESEHVMSKDGQTVKSAYNALNPPTARNSSEIVYRHLGRGLA